MQATIRQANFTRTPLQAAVVMALALGAAQGTAMATPATPTSAGDRWTILGGAVVTDGPAALINTTAGGAQASVAARLDKNTSQMAVAGSVSTPGTVGMTGFFNYNYLNTGPSTVRVSFHYSLSAGNVSFASNPGTANSEVRLANDVAVNGSWTSLGELLVLFANDSISSVSRVGDFGNLAGYGLGTAGILWGDSDYVVTLGDVAAGDSMAVSYRLGGTALLGNTAYCCHGTICNSSFRIGDPGAITALNQLMGLTFETLTDGGQVPVPATLALAAAGLAGLGMSRRKRK